MVQIQEQGKHSDKMLKKNIPNSSQFIGMICPTSQNIWDMLGKSPYWESVVRGLDYVSAPYQRYSDK